MLNRSTYNAGEVTLQTESVGSVRNWHACSNGCLHIGYNERVSEMFEYGIEKIVVSAVTDPSIRIRG